MSSRWSSLALLVVLGAWGFHLAHYAPFLSDDALISLRYAERLLDGHGLTWTDGERVEGYSDLAWVLLTALLHVFRVDLIVAARALGVVGVGVGLLVVSFRVERPTSISGARALSGALLLALSPPVAVWAIGALEHGFEAGVILFTGWLLMRQRVDQSITSAERWTLVVLLWLLTWLRADGIVLAAGLLFGFLLQEFSWRSLKRSLGLGSVPILATLVQLGARLAYYGDWVPNTAHVKAGFSRARLDLGLAHVKDWLNFGWPLVLAAVLSLLVLRGKARRALIPLFASVVWLAYVVAMGGDIFPAWRQVLLGIVPLALVVAEAAEWTWERISTRRVVMGVVIASWAALCAGYWHLQRKDPQNVRGVTERWEFDGYSLGPFMKHAWGPLRPLLAVDAAGALPYFSQLPSLDLLGLNDRYIATHPPPGGSVSTGHELGDGAYVWERKPDILSMCGAMGGRNACFLGGRQMLAHPQFSQQYQLIRVHSTHHHDLQTELWVRREVGVLGVKRSDDQLEIPGWLLAQASGTAELHEGTLQTVVTPETPGHLVGLEVPAGRWEIDAGPGLTVGVLCEGRGTTPTRGTVVLELAAPMRIDVLVGAPTVQWVKSIRLVRTAHEPTARCEGSVPTVMTVSIDQVAASAPERAYYLQPGGVKLTSPRTRVQLGARTGTRFRLLVDANDTLRLRALQGETSLGEQTLAATPTGGLAAREVMVPLEADAFELEVLGGDGLASLAAVLPLP